MVTDNCFRKFSRRRSLFFFEYFLCIVGGGTGKKRHPLKAIVAGGIAGAVEACISYPTE